MDLRVVIADDDALAQELIELTLGQDARFEVVGVAADGAGAVQTVAATTPDLLLLDIHMPGSEVGDVVTQVRLAAARTRIVLLSAMHAERAKEICLAVGADGFVSKNLSPRKLPDRLHKLAGV